MPANRPPAIALPETKPASRTERIFRARAQSFAARPKESATEIDLYDEIGAFGVTAKAFRDKLKGAGDIHLRINSPGGDVFDGVAIYNDLLRHQGKIDVEVTGVAASAASIIAMAGDEIVIAENAFLMIHNAWGVTIGNRHDHDEVSKLLAQVDDALAATYAARSGMNLRDIKRMMDEETWLNGKDALAAGLATAVSSIANANAKFDLTIFSKTPPTLRDEAVGDKALPDNIRDFEEFLRDAGFSNKLATAISSHGFKAADGQREADAALAELAAYIAAQTQSLQELH